MKGALNPRIVFSIILAGLGLMVAILPYKDNAAGQMNPGELLGKITTGMPYITVDEAASMLINEDTSILFIDLRSREEYRAFNIPGSVNIPYENLLDPGLKPYLHQDKGKNIFYSNGELVAGMAWSLTSRLGYSNNYILKGGMNEWFKTIIHSQFQGERITAAENALHEKRRKASKRFTEMNSLPDSLKTSYLEHVKVNEKKMAGGCE